MILHDQTWGHADGNPSTCSIQIKRRRERGQTFLHVSVLEMPCKPGPVDRPDNTQPYKRQKASTKDERKWKLFVLFPSLPLPCPHFRTSLISAKLSVSKARTWWNEPASTLVYNNTFTFFFSTQNQTTQRVLKKKGRQQLTTSLIKP